MKIFVKPQGFILLIFLMIISCRKLYNPPEISQNNHFLAVDGFINTSPNGYTTITVSRSRNLQDAATVIPELQAQVTIQASNGLIWDLQDTAGNGVYTVGPLNLDSTIEYQLKVNTADGNKYASDLVASESAPPLDSITWAKVIDPYTTQQAVMIYVNAHDPKNQTHYYRWDYLETFKHFSVLMTPWGEANGRIYAYPLDYSTHECWTTRPSANILIGTSIGLSQDVISQALIENIQQNDPKMDVGYSILVRQYPLTLQGYEYWLNVQKNSQSLGGLFDLQPSQLSGNFHCISNPNIPAVGFISASSVQSLRTYISNKSLPGWQSDPGYVCPTFSILQDQNDLLIYNYPDTSFGPYHFSGDFIIYLVVAPKSCMDCRYQGGVNVKPGFWPHYD
jgi:Domain of unknown function (DUF4249)